MWLAPDYIAKNYSSSVDEAINNEYSFLNFKSNPSYNSIVGMSLHWQGEFWYEYIKTNRKDILENLRKYSLNDSIGNPILLKTEEGISISPNTLRYINTAIEIEDFFKFDKKINVSELGVGYGGLCYVMNCHFDISNYGLIDLPNVQDLTLKYLDRLNTKNVQKGFIEDNDLFISEFCLSEFDDKEIYEFYEKYVINSKNIYLHMNLHEEDRKNRFLDRLKSDFNFEIFDEFPKTQWPNYVIKGSIK